MSPCTMHVTELALYSVLPDMQLYGLPDDACLQQKHVAAILAIKMCALLTNMDQIHNCPRNSEQFYNAELKKKEKPQS